MSLLSKRRRPKVGIDMVPLVDVLIVLIFFFLMTMQFRNLNVLHITPPRVESAGKNDPANEILIAVDAEGTYLYNNTRITEQELNTALSIASQSNPHQNILIVADEESALKHMTSVMDASRKAGLEKVRLQVR